jgi:CheY-like chemotaxis protein
MMPQGFAKTDLPHFFPEHPGHPEGGRVATHLDVLVIEDDRISRWALSHLLCDSGYRAGAVGSAEEALRLVEREGLPRLAVVDMQLPGMSGLELIERLRALDEHVIPVMVTAEAADELVSILNREGIAYLRKPLEMQRLLDVIEEVQSHAEFAPGDNRPRPA